MKKIMRNKEQRSSFNGGLSTKIKDTKPRRNYWAICMKKTLWMKVLLPILQKIMIIQIMTWRMIMTP